MLFNKRAINASKRTRPRRRANLFKPDEKCLEERQMLQSLSGLSLEQMVDRLNGYLSNHKPCINIKPKRPPSRKFHEGGYIHNNDPGNTDHCAGMCGDLNNDGGINVLDIVALVNLVLDGGYNPCGDLNSDGGMNVLDIVALINVILDGDWINNPPTGCPTQEDCELTTDPQCDPCEVTTDWPDLICLASGCGVRMDFCFQCGGSIWDCDVCCNQWNGTSEGECEMHHCAIGMCQWNGWEDINICEGPSAL